MPAFEDLKIKGIDFVELAVADLERSTDPFLKLGFEKAGSRELRERELRSYLLVQNDIQIVLSQSTKRTDPLAQFVTAHGDGVFDIAFLCEDAVSALEVAGQRGAVVLESPRSYQREEGTVHQAAIAAFGDVRHTLISRKGTLFAEGFDFIPRQSNKGSGLQKFDHVTAYVAEKDLAKSLAFYENVFGLRPSGANALQSSDGQIRLLFHIPEPNSPTIQEYLDINHGPGVQHLALSTPHLLDVVRVLRKGVRFLNVPPSYYEAVAGRIPGITESAHDLAALGVLVDGDSQGYLLQCFTEALIGPFSLEIVQRKGHEGFGEGNTAALNEAIERERVRHGIVNHTPSGSAPGGA